MDRDEVLRRVQDKKPNQLDEMEEEILNKGCRAGFVVGFAACAFTMIAKIIAGVSYYDVYAVYCFTVGGQWLYKWAKLKKRSDLGLGLMWVGLVVGLFAGYLAEIF